MWGSNFWLSHRNEMSHSPLTQGLNYRSACEAIGLIKLPGDVMYRV